jgi:hypothetical protein
LLQILLTIFFSSFKFAATFPLVILQFKFSFTESVLWTNVGGVAGIYFFSFLSEKLLGWWKRLFRRSRQDALNEKRPAKKRFTKKNRRIVRIKQRYGLIGIASMTPFLLSIPVGVFLVVRYYRASRAKFLYLIASNLAWSVIYTLFYMFWADLLLNRS